MHSLLTSVWTPEYLLYMYNPVPLYLRFATLFQLWPWRALSLGSHAPHADPVVMYVSFNFDFSFFVFSCPSLCDPTDCSPPGSSVHGTLQARRLEWVAMLFSSGSSQGSYSGLQHCRWMLSPSKPPEKPSFSFSCLYCFLIFCVSRSPCVFHALFLKSALSARSPGCFSWRIVRDTDTWASGVHAGLGRFLLSRLSCQTRKSVHMC